MSVKSILLKVVRNGLGLVIVFVDWITRSKAIQRSEADQLKAQSAIKDVSLYQFFACPFCTKVRRAIHRLGVTVEARDINKKPEYRQQLEAGGGRVKVPCLRIEKQGDVQWLYESDEIIQYLESKVSTAI